MTTQTPSTTAPPPTNETTRPTSSPNPSQKRPHPPSNPQKTHTTITLRAPTWAYIHLQHLTSSATTAPLDALTAHLHITAALNQYLGMHGAAVPVDVMKLREREVWIRVPAGDRTALVAAVGDWVGRNGEGWRVRGWSSWCAGVEGGRDLGREVFED